MKVLLTVYKKRPDKDGDCFRFTIDVDSVPRVGEEISSNKFGFSVVEKVVYLLSGPSDCMILVLAREQMPAHQLPGWLRKLVTDIGGGEVLQIFDNLVAAKNSREN